MPLASHKSLVSSAPPNHILVYTDNNIVDMDWTILRPGKARGEKIQKLSSQPVQRSRGVTPVRKEIEFDTRQNIIDNVFKLLERNHLMETNLIL